MHVVISTVEENMNNNNLIIVAEDDDDIAAILTGYLRKAGMKTLRAEDGEQAINLTRLNKPKYPAIGHPPARVRWLECSHHVKKGNECTGHHGDSTGSRR